MIIAPPNPETRRIVSMMTDLEQRMRRTEAGLRAAQLRNASITDGGINIYDDDGAIRTVIGKQEDGTYTAISTNNPNPPPVPSSPIVIPALASAIVRHTGETANGSGWPADLKALNIYYALAQNPDQWTAGGSLGTSFPEELPIAPLEYTDYLIAVTAVNHSGKESAKSEPVSVAPKQVVPNDLIEDIFSNVELSANSVTEAMLQVGVVTESKIAPDSISSPLIKSNAILGTHILADQIDGGKLTAQAITSRELRALAVIAGKIDVNAVTAGTIAAGAVTAVKLEANLILSSRIIAGTLNGNRVEVHPLLGLQAFTNNGQTRSFWLDAATGSGFFMGQIATAGSGERIVMNPGGNNPNRIQFWASNNAFAYIDTFTEGAAAAGITMQASGSDTRKVGTVWLRQQWAQLGIADSGLVAGSQFYAEPNFVRCRSATVDLIVDQGITPIQGPRRVAFIHYTTSGIPVPSSHLNYMEGADGKPWFWGVNQNSGLKFDTDAVAITNGNSMVFGPVAASAFLVSSSEEAKENITVPRFRGNRTSLNVVDEISVKEWGYRDSKAATPNGKRHRFPLAEELQAIDPSLVIRDSNDNLQVDLRDMIGVLLDAVRIQSDQIKELKATINGGN